MFRAGAYRVFSCDGSNTDDVILAAADRALADGMDIINLCALCRAIRVRVRVTPAHCAALCDGGDRKSAIARGPGYWAVNITSAVSVAVHFGYCAPNFSDCV